MNLLYVGPMGDAVNNLIAFSKICSKLIFANTDLFSFYNEVPGMKETVGKSCKVVNIYQSGHAAREKNNPRMAKILRYFASYFGLTVQRFLNRGTDQARLLREIIDEEKIDVVFAAWGIGVIPDILLLRSIDRTIPIIHYLPTFPTSYNSRLREKMEIWLMKRTAHLVDGFVVGSNRMKEFLSRELRLDEKVMIVAPICYTKDFFARAKMTPLSITDGEPHLIMTGSTRSTYACNNVGEQIIAIAKSGIHVHCTAIENSEDAGSYLHVFVGFDILRDTLDGFVTQFDGCLVLYNVPRPLLRFEISIPQRFLFCFTAGIPIFIPRGTFKSCEEIIEMHRNGFVFDSVEQLNAVLRDPIRMKELKENAERVQYEYSFEAQADNLKSFITAFLLPGVVNHA